MGEGKKEEDLTLIERAKTNKRAAQRRRANPIRTTCHRWAKAWKNARQEICNAKPDRREDLQDWLGTGRSRHGSPPQQGSELPWPEGADYVQHKWADPRR